jgi:magnesium chelatase accessory protein
MSAPRWEVEGRNWPHRETSRFVVSGDLTWHVQTMGSGPAIVLIHGTGAATHSWRGVIPLLAERFSVTAMDLPGHGFTRGRLRGGPTLPGIAAALSDLLAALQVRPILLAGHSAGAAIALRMIQARGARTPVAGLSPALLPFSGVAARVFPALAKLLFVNPLAPRIFSGMARAPGEAERFLVRATGSRIDAEGVRCYRALLGTSGHCAGALAMMADWDLEGLAGLLPAIEAPVALVHGEKDSAVPLESVRRAAGLLPNASFEVLPGLGHLAHEERPDLAVAAITRIAALHAMPA